MQLEKIFGKKNNLKIIKHLALHKNWEFNITEIAKDMKLNKGILSRAVKELEKENIITIKRKGKIMLFRLNENNLFIREWLIPFFEKEDSIINDYIKRKFRSLKLDSNTSIILYGSFAKGTQTLKSDIDVMVIGKRKNFDVKIFEKLKEDFLNNGLLLRIDYLSLGEARKSLKQNDPFIASLIINHKSILGKSMEDIL